MCAERRFETSTRPDDERKSFCNLKREDPRTSDGVWQTAPKRYGAIVDTSIDPSRSRRRRHRRTLSVDGDDDLRGDDDDDVEKRRPGRCRNAAEIGPAAQHRRRSPPSGEVRAGDAAAIDFRRRRLEQLSFRSGRRSPFDRSGGLNRRPADREGRRSGRKDGAEPAVERIQSGVRSGTSSHFRTQVASEAWSPVAADTANDVGSVQRAEDVFGVDGGQNLPRKKDSSPPGVFLKCKHDTKFLRSRWEELRVIVDLIEFRTSVTCFVNLLGIKKLNLKFQYLAAIKKMRVAVFHNRSSCKINLSA